jgi:hypothetical protein
MLFQLNKLPEITNLTRFLKPFGNCRNFVHIRHWSTVLVVGDRHVAFWEYNGSVARIICVAVATLANEKLLEHASDNDLLLCRKSTSNKTRYSFRFKRRQNKA